MDAPDRSAAPVPPPAGGRGGRGGRGRGGRGRGGAVPAPVPAIPETPAATYDRPSHTTTTPLKKDLLVYNAGLAYVARLEQLGLAFPLYIIDLSGLLADAFEYRKLDLDYGQLPVPSSKLEEDERFYKGMERRWSDAALEVLREKLQPMHPSPTLERGNVVAVFDLPSAADDGDVVRMQLFTDLVAAICRNVVLGGGDFTTIYTSTQSAQRYRAKGQYAPHRPCAGGTASRSTGVYTDDFCHPDRYISSLLYHSVVDAKNARGLDSTNVHYVGVPWDAALPSSKKMYRHAQGAPYFYSKERLEQLERMAGGYREQDTRCNMAKCTPYSGPAAAAPFRAFGEAVGATPTDVYVAMRSYDAQRGIRDGDTYEKNMFGYLAKDLGLRVERQDDPVPAERGGRGVKQATFSWTQTLNMLNYRLLTERFRNTADGNKWHGSPFAACPRGTSAQKRMWILDAANLASYWKVEGKDAEGRWVTDPSAVSQGNDTSLLRSRTHIAEHGLAYMVDDEQQAQVQIDRYWSQNAENYNSQSVPQQGIVLVVAHADEMWPRAGIEGGQEQVQPDWPMINTLWRMTRHVRVAGEPLFFLVVNYIKEDPEWIADTKPLEGELPPKWKKAFPEKGRGGDRDGRLVRVCAVKRGDADADDESNLKAFAHELCEADDYMASKIYRTAELDSFARIAVSNDMKYIKTEAEVQRAETLPGGFAQPEVAERSSAGPALSTQLWVAYEDSTPPQGTPAPDTRFPKTLLREHYVP